MATTFTIPLTTVPVGSQTFGPAGVADSEGTIVVTIDRTVSGGLNSLTAASTFNGDLQQSNDGGTTWFDRGTWGTSGGTILDKTGVAFSQQSGHWNLAPGTSRQLRVTVTVGGPSSIAIAGSIVTS